MNNPPIRSSIPNPPIHVLSSFVTIILDWFWFSIELPETISVALLPALLPTSITLGVICLVAVTLVQKLVDNDNWGTSFAKGLVMGIVAGVPYPVVGTTIGGPLLVWGGIYEVKKLLASPKQ